MYVFNVFVKEYMSVINLFVLPIINIYRSIKLNHVNHWSLETMKLNV